MSLILSFILYSYIFAENQLLQSYLKKIENTFYIRIFSIQMNCFKIDQNDS